MAEIVERESSKSATCLLLPQLSGVDMYPFTVNDVDSDCGGAGDQSNLNYPGSWRYLAGDEERLFTDADIDRITRIPADKEVRAIVLFLTETSDADSEFGRSLVYRYGARNTVIAGGFADRVITDSVSLQ